jgi:hypothetical protein
MARVTERILNRMGSVPCSVVDRHHLDADRIQMRLFIFDADTDPDPDPTPSLKYGGKSERFFIFIVVLVYMFFLKFTFALLFIKMDTGTDLVSDRYHLT